MRLSAEPRLPSPGSIDYERQLNIQIVRLLRDIATQVNGVSEGQIYANHNALTAAPTSGTWGQGDTIKNSAPTELGTSPNKYVITAFVCVASGTPGTWVSMRSLTGN